MSASLPGLTDMHGTEVTLQQVLKARERRRDMQRRLRSEYNLPVVCFTMNIAGEIKRTPLIEFAFDSGVSAIEGALGAAVYREIIREPTGCEAFFVYGRPAQDLKSICIGMESNGPVGRLYDMDVIGIDGKKLSRGTERTCIVCGGPAACCSRSRAHGLDSVKSRTSQLLCSFAAEKLASLAVEALKEEVRLTPKPGLVDLNNQGAHRDMDVLIFERSADSLKSYFEKAVLLGTESQDCMRDLQRAGREAESEMFRATGGVNTHKGAVYTFGLLLAAMGSSLARGSELFNQVGRLAKAGEEPVQPTHGTEVFQRYGIKGARQEAESGLPSVRNAYDRLRRSEDPITVLLHLIAECSDTNLLYRGGMEGLKYAGKWASFILRSPPALRVPLTVRMDRALIRRNLSPGGCADILAAALFLCRAEGAWNRQ